MFDRPPVSVHLPLSTVLCFLSFFVHCFSFSPTLLLFRWFFTDKLTDSIEFTRIFVNLYGHTYRSVYRGDEVDSRGCKAIDIYDVSVEKCFAQEFYHAYWRISRVLCSVSIFFISESHGGIWNIRKIWSSSLIEIYFLSRGFYLLLYMKSLATITTFSSELKKLFIIIVLCSALCLQVYEHISEHQIPKSISKIIAEIDLHSEKSEKRHKSPRFRQVALFHRYKLHCYTVAKLYIEQ